MIATLVIAALCSFSIFREARRRGKPPLFYVAIMFLVWSISVTIGSIFNPLSSFVSLVISLAVQGLGIALVWKKLKASPPLRRIITEDPTLEWPLADAEPVKICWDEGLLNDVPFRSGYDEMQAFGQPDRFELLSPRFQRLFYERQRLQVDVDDDEFVYAKVSFQSELQEEDVAQSAVVICDGAVRLEIDAKSSADEIREQMGQPVDEEEQGNERLMIYEQPEAFLIFRSEIESGQLHELEIECRSQA